MRIIRPFFGTAKIILRFFNEISGIFIIVIRVIFRVIFDDFVDFFNFFFCCKNKTVIRKVGIEGICAFIYKNLGSHDEIFVHPCFCAPVPADYIAISRNNRVRTADLHDSIVNNNRLRAKFIGSGAQAVVRCINNKLVVAAPAGIEAAFEICACGGVGCVDFYGRLLQNPLNRRLVLRMFNRNGRFAPCPVRTRRTKYKHHY